MLGALSLRNKARAFVAAMMAILPLVSRVALPGQESARSEVLLQDPVRCINFPEIDFLGESGCFDGLECHLPQKRRGGDVSESRHKGEKQFNISDCIYQILKP